jgi:phosphoribosyl-ATP pyrophosphohydrolase/phosphoribosyl-AMP cyclohydrolase/histidinol dehydrogenase
MSATLLPRRTLAELIAARGAAISPSAIAAAAPIVAAVRARGEAALREYAEQFSELTTDGQLVVDRAALERALAILGPDDRARLARVAARIRAFAEAQRDALRPVTIDVPGGQAGHWVAPVRRVGCYAPGGRYPLPSSVLMTVVTARTAGVSEVWVASPRPAPITLAAAAMGGADGLVAAGGAQAIAALAYGAGAIPACDMIAGPGNSYVTAAKQLVSSDAGIDMLAGASELVVFADDTGDAATIAADLLAQAEHDPDAFPVLVTTDSSLHSRVQAELDRQLSGLPTSDVARAALAHGGAVVVRSVADGVAACDALAPEHLALVLRDADTVAPRLAHFGAVFIGARAGEVLGDYGIGPNHVLPTAGTARFRGGLSVFSFLRIRSWVRIDSAKEARPAAEDAIWFGRVEGLEAHARSAERRLD